MVTRPWACTPIAAAATTADPTAPANSLFEIRLMRFLHTPFLDGIPAAAAEEFLPGRRKGQPSFAETYGLVRGISNAGRFWHQASLELTAPRYPPPIGDRPMRIGLFYQIQVPKPW